jgi:hypothetical protein
MNAEAGQTVQVLVTISYTGTSTSVAGFGSADFQPTISQWRAGDTLLPIREGGNVLPSDGSGMVMPQFYMGVSAGGSGAPYGHVHAGYQAGTYGRVLPMGRTWVGGATALTGFVHNNPDGSGQMYLRIAQASQPTWGAPGSGVNPAQLYVVGRTTADPDFWGNRDTVLVDPSDPSQGFDVTPRIAANDSRRTNVEVFRFGFVVGGDPNETRYMTIDAPLSMQQGYVGYFTNTSQAAPGLQLTQVVQTAEVWVHVPSPGTLAMLGCCLARRRRRRRLAT